MEKTTQDGPITPIRVMDEQLLSRARHELRQPLHAMGLFIDNLRETPLSAAQAAMVDHLDEALRQQMNLVDALGVPQAGKRKPQGAAAGPGPDAATGLHATPPEDEAAFTGLTVMLIDDDENLLEHLAAIMRRWGFRVMQAVSGEQAHARLKEAGGRTDLIVSDLRLGGGESGAQLIGALREKFGAHMPALIVTGDQSTQAAEELQACGLARLYKPVRASRLKAMIGHMLGDGRVAPAG